jgi:hypothetical protein
MEKLQKMDGESFPSTVLYIIWKNPWMAVRSDTYIGSVLKHFGAPLADLKTESRYPELLEAELEKHYLLLSSEPFPFHKKKQEMTGLTGSIVDGEKYGWFGIRSLNFLKANQ